MTSSTFRIAFEGAALEDGEIDVRDLAPALLALGDVVQAAKRAKLLGRKQLFLDQIPSPFLQPDECALNAAAWRAWLAQSESSAHLCVYDSIARKCK